MVKYTLTYFDLRGFGETARVLFNYAGVEFTDKRIQFEEWPSIKPTTLTGKLPILEVDDFVLVESFAINQFLARRFGLAGADEFEQATALSVADTFRDGWKETRPYIVAATGFEEGNKDELYKSALIPARDSIFPWLQKTLDKSGSGFIVKSGVTWADFFISESIVTIQGLDPEFEKKYPALVEYEKRVHSLPQIKDYIATRKQTPL